VACWHGLLIDHDPNQACEILSVTRVIPGNLTWMAGHFLLTNLLLENMKSACRESGVEGRIVNLSSGHVMTYPEGICFDKIHDPSG
jgi:NAD(P)-dependent dehydrogenase (short-subunit alcohol dehydrogenase family)